MKDKHFSLFQKFVNYSSKKFIILGPGKRKKGNVDVVYSLSRSQCQQRWSESNRRPWDDEPNGGNPHRRERISTVNLLVLISLH